ncbi:hypothetical protein SHELI_v1c09340 [Spiroplasma helicoides]|uniref:Uncharacterized protein n=1 Tax=Spiroplasma helicoides TaxID=216938 RepID=A0A1B3SLS9_9MOLU|nr:hypothetical protein [Spiroplasma helicoides]AOG60883.1 hypothetical protein SHELI_v1c09340 [Spiroplasma helicoides]
MENNRQKIILKITISSLISAFLTVFNLITIYLPGLDISYFIIAIICIVLTWDIGLFVTITTSFLAFLYKAPVFWCN